MTHTLSVGPPGSLAQDVSRAFLSTAPASRATHRRALGLSLCSVLLFVALVPFARQPLAPLPAFIPAYQSALIVCDLVTAVLLCGQWQALRRAGLLWLSAGYLFSAAMAGVHMLTFPDLFSPGGLLGAGPQSTAWLYMFWHVGLPLTVIAYTRLEDRSVETPAPVERPGPRLAAAAAGVVLAVVALTLMGTLGAPWLPEIMIGHQQSPAMTAVVGTVWLTTVMALVLLWRRRRRTVLDLWLTVVMCAWVFDIALSAVFNAGRFDLGWYAGRMYGLFAASYVLAELLFENGRLHARLVDLHHRDREHAQVLAAARDAALAADRAKGQFLATMSHEIRTPMNAIVGFSHLVLDTDLSDRQRGYLGKLYTASKSLMRLLDDILDYSKIDAGRLTLENEVFSPDEVIDSVVGHFEGRVGVSGLDFVVDVAPDVPQQLSGDPFRLGQVLTNLVGNAVKFTEHGEIVLSVRLDSSSLAPEVDRPEAATMLHFEVRDTGIGLTAEQLTHLFGPFTQVESSNARRYGGTGLGLALCRRIVALMGGQVGATSEPGRGSVFAFTAKFGAAPRSQPPVQSPRLRGKRAIVVDGHQTASSVHRQLLQSRGLRVDVASSADAALAELRLAEAAGQPYELMLLDDSAPGLDSNDHLALKLRRISHHMANPRLAIILMAGADANERVLALSTAVPADVVMRKPVTRSRLHDALSRLEGSGETAPSRTVQPRNDPQAAIRAIRGARVLLAEDNIVNQVVASEFLARAGMRVSIAGNGLEAVDWVKAADFDLVLMDVQMPEMDGLEATRMIRSLPEGRSLPIIALTASALDEDRRACSAAGMNGHIAKPIDAAVLATTLLAWIPRADRPPVPTSEPERTGGAAVLEELLPGVAVREALDRLAGDTHRYQSLLRIYARRHSHALQSIERLHASDNWAELAQVVRPLATAATLLGIKAVAGPAHELLEELMCPDTRSLAALVRALGDALGHMSTDMARVGARLSRDELVAQP